MANDGRTQIATVFLPSIATSSGENLWHSVAKTEYSVAKTGKNELCKFFGWQIDGKELRK